MSLARIRKPTLVVLSLLLVVGLLSAALAPSPVQADTGVGGPIISNTTWTKAQSPYLVVANIEVWQGVTLTIEPGVVVKVQTGKLIQVGGTLIARGSAGQIITFTSAKSSPAKGDWANIRFTSTAVPTTMDAAGNYVSGSVLQYCVVEYGGASGSGAIEARSLLIDHCSIRYNTTTGICDTGTDDAPARITNNAIISNSARGGEWAGGGGIYTKSGIVSANSIFLNNVNSNPGYGWAYGGGIYAENSSISNNVIGGNTASGNWAYGGGIYAGNCTISNNNINTNFALGTYEGGGGGIYAEGSTLRNNVVSDNSTRNENGDWAYGGGIYAKSSSFIRDNTVNNNSVRSNYEGYGGGIYAVESDVISNTVSANTLSTNGIEWIGQLSGGGIYARDSTVSGNIVNGNTINQKPAYGGGIYAGNSIINDNLVTSNSAFSSNGGYGGGIYAENSSSRGNTISRNLARRGGGIYASGTMMGNAVIGNFATEQGSGVFLASGNVLTNTITGNTTSSPSTVVGGLAINGTPEMHYNNLYGNAPYDVVILQSGDVNGANNYWGTVTNIDILAHVYDWYDDTSRGRLLYIPYLQDPDPNAPVPPPLNLRGSFSGSSATLTWDPIPSTTTGYGYKIYYDSDYSGPPYNGAGLAQGNSPIDAGNATSFTLTGLAGGKYYFAVTGYDNQGHESWYSNQLIRLNKVYLPLIRR